MIDTIVISLPKESFRITDPHKFEPSAQWAMQDTYKSHRVLQSKQNPTKKELRNRIYKPRLTLTQRIKSRRARETVLKIELSLPKLMFGNNFAELRFKDFSALIHKLSAALADMGIETTAQELAQAPISGIHYSKNIIFTDGSIPYHYIQRIRESNIQLTLDTNQTDYRNEGHGYKLHCNSYEVAFYDKIKDLEQANISDKRAFEDDNELQMHLFKKFQKRTKKFEVLRMEVRLNKRAKIKQLFKKLKINADVTFKKLFKPAISKKVLLHYLDEIECKRLLLLDYHVKSPQRLLVDLVFNNPDLTARQIMQAFGLKQALAEMNLRELRMMFGGKNKRNWYQLMAEAAKIKLPVTYAPLRSLRDMLEKFELIKDKKIKKKKLE
jgi:hypothetical protein